MNSRKAIYTFESKLLPEFLNEHCAPLSTNGTWRTELKRELYSGNYRIKGQPFRNASTENWKDRETFAYIQDCAGLLSPEKFHQLTHVGETLLSQMVTTWQITANKTPLRNGKAGAFTQISQQNNTFHISTSMRQWTENETPLILEIKYSAFCPQKDKYTIGDSTLTFYIQNDDEKRTETKTQRAILQKQSVTSGRIPIRTMSPEDFLVEQLHTSIEKDLLGLPEETEHRRVLREIHDVIETKKRLSALGETVTICEKILSSLCFKNTLPSSANTSYPLLCLWYLKAINDQFFKIRQQLERSSLAEKKAILAAVTAFSVTLIPNSLAPLPEAKSSPGNAVFLSQQLAQSIGFFESLSFDYPLSRKKEPARPEETTQNSLPIPAEKIGTFFTLHTTLTRLTWVVFWKRHAALQNLYEKLHSLMPPSKKVAISSPEEAVQQLKTRLYNYLIHIQKIPVDSKAAFSVNKERIKAFEARYPFFTRSAKAHYALSLLEAIEAIEQAGMSPEAIASKTADLVDVLEAIIEKNKTYRLRASNRFNDKTFYATAEGKIETLDSLEELLDSLKDQQAAHSRRPIGISVPRTPTKEPSSPTPKHMDNHHRLPRLLGSLWAFFGALRRRSKRIFTHAAKASATTQIQVSLLSPPTTPGRK